MSSFRLLLLVAAACAVALGAAVVVRGSHAATPPPVLPKAQSPSAPTLAPGASSGPTVATAQRTFVSTSGSDSNPCSATSPCRSFGTALTATAAGGEIVVLTSGGYGPVSIDKAVAIVGAPGVHAAITVSSGDAIDVAAGASDTVVLRNLYLNSLGGTVGVNYVSGKALHLEGLTIAGFTQFGVVVSAVNGALYASDVVTRSGYDGFLLSPSSGLAHVTLDRVRVEGNSSIGIWNVSNTRMRVSNCIASGNGWGIVAYASTFVSGCQLSENTNQGLLVGSGATAQIGGSSITSNGIGLDNESGTLQSFGDNLVAGNTANTGGTITTISKT